MSGLAYVDEVDTTSVGFAQHYLHHLLQLSSRVYVQW